MTELCLSSEEFDQFAVNTETSITFCLKELRVSTHASSLKSLAENVVQ